jgi:hypothetical protein
MVKEAQRRNVVKYHDPKAIEKVNTAIIPVNRYVKNMKYIGSNMSIE